MNQTPNPTQDSNSMMEPTEQSISEPLSEPFTDTVASLPGTVTATFLDGHMEGRMIPVFSDQTELTFNKLEKPYLEAPAELVLITYRKVEDKSTDAESVFALYKEPNGD